MSLYERPVRQLMRDMVERLHLQQAQIITKPEVVAWFKENYPKIKRSTVEAHLIRLSTNAVSRFHYSAKPGEDDLFFSVGGGRYRLFNAQTDPAPLYGKPAIDTSKERDDDALDSSDREFAYESDLRDFLSRNLTLLGPGLKLFNDAEEDITGVEFSVGGRFIDILAVDNQRDYVVIELKVSRGYDRVVGQLLRYMAWIAKYHADTGQKVRGIIVAREISEDLKLACSTVPDISLFEYELKVAVRKIEP